MSLMAGQTAGSIAPNFSEITRFGQNNLIYHNIFFKT